MGLLSVPLVALVATLALAAPLVVAWIWSRSRRRRGSAPDTGGTTGRTGAVTGRAVGPTVGLVIGCVVSQLLAISAVGLVVNDQYQFYTSFGDLAGRSGAPAPIQINGSTQAHGGRLTTLMVHGKTSATNAQVLVWLPPGYRAPKYRHHRFPVVEFIPGQPSTAPIAYSRFDLGRRAAAAIRGGVPPFVLVVPPLMIRPPTDTECTDIPHGTQALSWLTKDVPAAVTAHFRVRPPGREWSVMGWSTGAFCAAKILLSEPHRIHAAVALGGYYKPTMRGVPRNIFGGSRVVADHNSPMWLYRFGGGLHGGHLLMIAGRQDKETWHATRAMVRATAGDADVSYVDFPTGGHNYRNYSAYVGPAFRWLRSTGALG